MNVALIMGGDSCERDISVITGLQAYENMNRSRHDVTVLYCYNGALYAAKKEIAADTATYISFDTSKAANVMFAGNTLCELKRGKLKKVKTIDVCLLCTHGGNGENGVLQGMLEFNRIPYTSCGVGASAVTMDKWLTKLILKGIGVNTLDAVKVRKNGDVIKDVEKAFESFGSPVIIKPCSLGSSIGIKTANTLDEAISAAELAACYDNDILIERALTDFSEFNCACAEIGGRVTVSAIEKPELKGDILDFNSKYMSTGKMNGGGRELPAKITEDLSAVIRSVTEKLYVELGMSGVVRIDFLYDNAERALYVNEINSIPGSLAFYLFEKVGINYSMLIQELLQSAISRSERDKELVKTYKSSVLSVRKGNAGKLCRK